MNDLGFPLEVLMELAGMSVAHTVYDINKNYEKGSIKNILVIVGPGNNRGDGLVAARHLCNLNFNVTVL